MEDDKKAGLISEFMRSGYKIARIKDTNTNKFQRGIIFDASTIRYVRSHTRSQLRALIFESLKELFPVTDAVIELAMNDYLTNNRPKKNLPRRHFPKRQF